MRPFFVGWGVTLGLLCGGGLVGSRLAEAEDFVCGNATRLVRYVESVDPTRMADTNCIMIAKENTAAQRALIQIVPKKYLKVVGGLAVELTAQEKSVVDAAIAQTAATAQTLRDELATDTLCNLVSLGSINAAINTREAAIQAQLDTARDTLATQITAITNLAEAKTAMAALNTTYHTAVSVVNTTHFNVVQKILRCEFARQKVGGRGQPPAP